MGYNSELLEYIDAIGDRNEVAESCAVFTLHDRNFMSPVQTASLPASLCGLLLCNRGTLQIANGTKVHRMVPMSILPVAPWQNLSFRQAENFSGSLVLFASHSIHNGLMQIDHACELLLHFITNAIIPIEEKEYDSLRKIFRVIGYLSSVESGSTSFTRATQHCIATTLYIVHDAVRAAEKGNSPCSRNRQNELFCKFFHLLLLNYKQHRSVSYYANQLCFTPRYLSTVIKAASGRSVVEWIDDFVVSEMMYQLRHTMRSMQQIAYDMNFSNQSFFGRYFKARVGCSPTDYRSKNRT